MLTNIILAFIGLFIGILSLFTDLNHPRGKISAAILIGLLILACGFQIQEQHENEEEITEQKQQIATLGKVLTNFEANTANSLNELKTLLNSFGSVNQNPDFRSAQRSVRADQLRTELSKLHPPNSRRDITVQYFPKDVDRQIVETALRELGFNLISGEANLPNAATNAIWFGRDITTNDVKLVAFTLIRAGVEIKAIRPFNNSDERRILLIQVGSDDEYQTKDALLLDDISLTQEFTR